MHETRSFEAPPTGDDFVYSAALTQLVLERSPDLITLTDPDGTLVYLLGTARDVSEREELRERVQEVDVLYRIADAIGRAGGLTELFTEAVETLIDATQADRASVLLSNDAAPMRFVAWHGLS